MIKVNKVMFVFEKFEKEHDLLLLKFMFSKNAMKIDEIFTVNLTLCSKCQIDGEDFIYFCGLLRKHELYHMSPGA